MNYEGNDMIVCVHEWGIPKPVATGTDVQIFLFILDVFPCLIQHLCWRVVGEAWLKK